MQLATGHIQRGRGRGSCRRNIRARCRGRPRKPGRASFERDSACQLPSRYSPLLPQVDSRLKSRPCAGRGAGTSATRFVVASRALFCGFRNDPSPRQQVGVRLWLEEHRVGFGLSRGARCGGPSGKSEQAVDGGGWSSAHGTCHTALNRPRPYEWEQKPRARGKRLLSEIRRPLHCAPRLLVLVVQTVPRTLQPLEVLEMRRQGTPSPASCTASRPSP